MSKLSHKNKHTRRARKTPTAASIAPAPPDRTLTNGGVHSFPSVTLGNPMVGCPEFGPVIGIPRPWIVAPAYGNQITTAYARSVAKYKEIYYQQYGQWPINDWIGQESCVPRARNNLARMAMTAPQPPTHLVFIDVDIEFDPQQLHDCLCSSLPIVVGGYAKKAYDFQKAFDLMQKGVIKDAMDLEYAGTDPVVNFHEEHIAAGQAPTVPLMKLDGTPNPDKHFVVVKEAGCGFMSIRLEVLRHMVKSYPQRRYICDDNSGPGMETFNLFSNEVDPYPKDPLNPRFITEDYLFSRLAQRIGIPTFCYAQAKLGHQGTMIYKSALWKAFSMTKPSVAATMPTTSPVNGAPTGV